MKKKIVNSIIVSLLLVSLNINPLAPLLQVMGEDVYGIFYNLSHVKADENYHDDLQSIVGATNSIKAYLQDGTLTVDAGRGSVLVGELEDQNKSLQSLVNYETTMNSHFGKISSQLSEITAAIKADQHAYSVAHVYSLNNDLPNCLYRPHSDEIPYVDDIVSTTYHTASNYFGYWDANYTDIQKPITPSRAYEILGYDILVRAEGLLYNNKFIEDAYGYDQHPQYYQELIPEYDITWLDAVTVLYRALGQEELSYQFLATPDPFITPETSPAAKGLSNITNFEAVRVNMFTSHANIIKELTSSANNVNTYALEYVYWNKAIKDCLVNSDLRDQPITAKDFWVLAADMMQLYGEPVMTEKEIQALLQVYGAEYPVQLGADIADSWAYLKARGCLNVDMTYSNTVSREQLLDVAMCIKDKDSRTNFKELTLTVSLETSMQDLGYFPVKDLKMTDSVSRHTEYDATATTYFDYLLAYPKSIWLTYNGQELNNFILSNGTATNSTQIEGSSVVGIKEVAGNTFLHLRIPKDYTGAVYAHPVYVDGSTQKIPDNCYIAFESGCLGGGIYSAYTQNAEKTILSYVNKDIKTFDSMATQDYVEYVDYVRACVDKPASTTASVVDTPLQKLSVTWNGITTPMVAHAATSTTRGNKVFYTLDTTPKDIERTAVEGEYKRYNDDTLRSLTYMQNISRAVKSAGLLSAAQYPGLQASNVKTIFTTRLIDNATATTFKTQNSMSSYDLVSAGNIEVNWNDPLSFGSSWADNGSSTTPKDVPTLSGSADADLRHDAVTQLSSLWNEDHSFQYAELTAMSDTAKMQFELAYRTAPNTLPTSFEEFMSNQLEGKTSSSTAQQGTNSTTLAYQSLAVSMQSDAIMNRRQSIMLAWSDLLSAGVCYDTFNGKQPSPANDGVYYISTNNGISKVNVSNATMLVGSTFYNLHSESDNDPDPMLIYYDPNQKETYIDLRCIIGTILPDDFTYVNGQYSTTSNSISAGQTAVYTLSGQENSLSLYQAKAHQTFSVTNKDSNYPINIIESIPHLDNVQDPTTQYTYHPSFGMRCTLNAFNPLSNYLLALHSVDAGSSASLFVWYPKVAFSSNDIFSTLSPGEQYSIDGVGTVIPDFSGLSDELSNALSTIREVISDYEKALDPSEVDSWYVKSTESALIHLYDLTGGSYFVSPEYVIREFPIVDSTILETKNLWLEQAPTSNDDGAIYWASGIGFIYNIPKDEAFSMNKYLAGIYPLPIAYDSSYNINNYNVPYYGTINYLDGDSVKQESGVPYGIALTTKGFIDFRTGDKSVYKSKDILPTISNNHSTDLPFKIEDFIMAPCGVTTFIGGYSYEFAEASEINVNATKSNYVFYGTERIFYDLSQKQDTQIAYKLFSENSDYASVTLNPATRFYRVNRNKYGSYLACYSDNVRVNTKVDVNKINIEDTYSGDIRQTIDKVNSLMDLDGMIGLLWTILLQIIPMLLLLYASLLLVVSVFTTMRFFRNFSEHVFDIVKVLTLGMRDCTSWSPLNGIIASVLLLASASLWLNGNILYILEAFMRFFDMLKNL